MYDFNCGEPLLPGWYDTENRSLGTLITDAIGIVSIIVGVVQFAVGPSADIAGLGVQLAAFSVPLVGGFVWWKKCQESKEGVPACMAGIVDSISAPQTLNHLGDFEDYGGWAMDEAEKTGWFPFLQDHPSFTLVVKCKYWNQLQSGAGYQWYNENIAGEAVSPIVICYQRDENLCSRIVTSIIEATMGAAVGSFLGTIAMNTIIALSAGSVVGAIFALLAFLAIAFVCAIIGANLEEIWSDFWGTDRQNEPPPSTVAGPSEENLASRIITVGDCLAVKGNLVMEESQNGARVFWFVEDVAYYGHIEDMPGIFPRPAFTSDMANETEFLTEYGTDGETIIHKEESFCESNGTTCLRFAEFESMTINFPRNVHYGWYITSDDTSSLSITDRGVPSGTTKLLVHSNVLIVFDRPVVNVRAKVVWEGKSPVILTAYDPDSVEVDSVSAPMVSDTIHDLEVSGTKIRHIEISAEEGLVIEVCVDYPELIKIVDTKYK